MAQRPPQCIAPPNCSSQKLSVACIYSAMHARNMHGGQSRDTAGMHGCCGGTTWCGRYRGICMQGSRHDTAAIMWVMWPMQRLRIDIRALVEKVLDPQEVGESLPASASNAVSWAGHWQAHMVHCSRHGTACGLHATATAMPLPTPSTRGAERTARPIHIQQSLGDWTRQAITGSVRYTARYGLHCLDQ